MEFTRDDSCHGRSSQSDAKRLSSSGLPAPTPTHREPMYIFHGTPGKLQSETDLISVSSMSSSSKSRLCRKCKDPAIEYVKPLIPCSSCQTLWHPICHPTYIENKHGETISPNWRCYRCTRKPEPVPSTASGPRGANITIKSAPIAAASSKGPGSYVSDIFSSRQCERIGCDKPVVQTTGLSAWKEDANVSRVCKQHQMEERHRLASRHRQEVNQIHSNAGSQGSICRKRLYKSTFKNGHRSGEFIETPVNTTAEISFAAAFSTDSTAARVTQEQGSATISISVSPPKAKNDVNVPGIEAKLFDQLPVAVKGVTGGLNNEWASAPSLDNTNQQDAEMADAPETGQTELGAAGILHTALTHGVQSRELYGRSNNGPHRVRADNELRKQRCLETLQAEWGESFHARLPAWPNPPGKTFLEHLVKLCKVDGVPFEDFERGITAIYQQRVAGKPTRQGIEQFIKLSDVKAFASQYEDGKQQSNRPGEPAHKSVVEELRRPPYFKDVAAEMPLHNTNINGNVTQCLAPTNSCTITDQAAVNNSTIETPQTTKDAAMQQMDAVIIQPVKDQEKQPSSNLPTADKEPPDNMHCETIVASVHPQSIEARRMKQDSSQQSELDAFLQAPKNLTGKYDKTAWGKINPTVDWPPSQVLDPKFLEDKHKEIAARSIRKSAERYGKHLTPEVIKFRKEMGWEKHQNRPARPASKDVARHMREMFGLADVNNMTPYLYNGKLHMGDKTEDGSLPTKLYPVE